MIFTDLTVKQIQVLLMFFPPPLYFTETIQEVLTGFSQKNTFFALISPDTNTLHPNFFQSLYNFTTSLPPVLWDFHFFKTNPTAHATLNGSDEEKKFLKSSKGSPTYLRVVDDVFGFFFNSAFFRRCRKTFFFPKRKVFQHTGKKRRNCSEQNLDIFSDQNFWSASVVYQGTVSSHFLSLSLSLSSRFGTLISLSLRDQILSTHGR